MKRFATILGIVLVLLLMFGAGYILGRWVGSYRQARFDLVVGLSTDAKLKQNMTEAIRSDNAVRIEAAYRTIKALPNWIVVFQPGSKATSEKKQAERAAALEEVLSHRPGFEISEAEAHAFVSRHLSKTETFSVSVR